ncbi:MAG: hypothetical protein K8W52_16465 [Deltaproteobacteria bacterium]|nr:hypothetical protein [Deltaproteobacteria bacterium]
MRRDSLLLTLALACALAACGGPDYLSTAELMDPETCKTCHQTHYDQWSGSMHAYAADDPVFVAMNARGQAATNGALGSFCINCHAPMAVKLGLTTDGTNVATLPKYAKGVTCYFCHQVDEIIDDHNNALHLADDGVMRGGISNPVDSPAHAAASSPLHDGSARDSSRMCGSCHDVVTPAGVHIERTFAEWKGTIFGHDDPRTFLSCGTCHMFAKDGVVADVPDVAVPFRTLGLHEHTFGGIDAALTPWPQMAEQRAAIQRDLDPAVVAKICVTPVNGDQIELTLDNRGVGHQWPSGAAHDRRAWVEVIAYDDSDQPIFSSGAVADGQDPEDLSATDPNLWRLGDDVVDANNKPVKFFWEVASYTANTLKAAVTIDPSDPAFYHASNRVYPIPGKRALIKRLTVRLRIRPLPFALMQDLVDGGELDPAVPGQLPTYELGAAVREWKRGDPLCI